MYKIIPNIWLTPHSVVFQRQLRFLQKDSDCKVFGHLRNYQHTCYLEGHSQHVKGKWNWKISFFFEICAHEGSSKSLWKWHIMKKLSMDFNFFCTYTKINLAVNSIFPLSFLKYPHVISQLCVTSTEISWDKWLTRWGLFWPQDCVPPCSGMWWRLAVLMSAVQPDHGEPNSTEIQLTHSSFTPYVVSPYKAIHDSIIGSP